MLEEKKSKIKNCDKSCFSVSEELILKGFACEKCGTEPTAIASLSARNLFFLTERLLDGHLDDLISAIRIAWTNSDIQEKLIAIHENLKTLNEDPA
jgi:hypothetical protein